MYQYFSKKNYFTKAAIILLVMFMQNNVIAQNEKAICEPKTFFDLFAKKDTLKAPKPAKNSFFIILPVIGSQPATGFVFGGVAQYTFKGKEAQDKYSVVNLGVTYTTKKQLLINAKNSVLLKENKIYLSGDYRLYLFSQPNYGLGTSIIPGNNQDPDFDIDAIAQPMDYNYFKFHQAMSWEVKKNFYVGAGIDIDWYAAIKDKDLDVANEQYTYHYNYNLKNGFDDLEYFVNGFSLNLVYDSRDNQVNATHGIFANLNYRMNPDLFNNQRNSTVLYTEYRQFIPLSKTNERYVLAFWTYGQFVTSGKVPYLNLPAIGWDQRNRSGEGYTQGLFRGSNLVYLSTEFRFPLSCNQMFSGTVFTNFTTASNSETNEKLFQYVQPAVGIGLRILIDKATRTNLIVDYAWGRKSKGFYLNAGETF
ncbi:BamA/TamA family outer membrane protein [Flavobacterium hydatis]|uniref:Bacterial surface antigen (D15) domain-containing protein n=1 Tax=Flavobacterium hydatis TaxID=991 RepID=A0A086AGJ9_FLAHY|nr:BamA/TamA family outer membrane protein [Flavobacterium hydatis]KFF15813.1 hypothetical protein IW20_13015 [Flavobacterium hydatis]OXA92315.1 hypothetical protein B0A62_15665 [Flavobacterium hydatis]